MNKYLICFIILLKMITISAQAQNLENEKPIAEIPFNIYSTGVIVVKAQLLPFKDSFTFILDTGSGGASLDSLTCVEHGINVEESNTIVTGVGASRKVKFARNRSLQFESIRMDSFNFHSNDYEILEAVYGERIHGILGLQFFERYTTKIDYDKHIIFLYDKSIELKATKHSISLPFQLNGIPVLNANIADNKSIAGNFYLDTGAGLNLLLEEKNVSQAKLFKRKRKKFPTQAEGMNGVLPMDIMILKSFKIGKYKFRKVPVYVFSDSFNVLKYPQQIGLLGNDLLKRFNMTISYNHKILILEPNEKFRDGFDYSYSGLNFYYHDERIFIDRVMPKSPAEISGLREGDEIVSIDNNFEGNIQKYKILIQKTGSHLMLIRRNNKLMMIRIEVIDIF